MKSVHVVIVICLSLTIYMTTLYPLFFPSSHTVRFLPPTGNEVKAFLHDAFTTENALYVGGMLSLTFALPYGSRLAWNLLEQKLLHSATIIDKGAHPVYGRWDRLMRWWAGYKTPEMIFDSAKEKNQLTRIQQKTKNVRNKILKGDTQATYTNLLLSGRPGTGKTVFAQLLADYADMNFLPTKLSLLKSPGAFDRLREMANNSPYGTIIFIDEADSLFMDRSQLLKSPSPDALALYALLNDVLASMGQRSNKYMIVAATNFPHVMDEAMDRRFPDKIEISLPDEPTRFALLNMYVTNLLFNEKNNSAEFVTSVRALLTPQFLQALAVRLAGFSHAQIENLVHGIKDSTHETEKSTLTSVDIERVVEQALKNYATAEQNRIKREALFARPS